MKNYLDGEIKLTHFEEVSFYLQKLWQKTRVLFIRPECQDVKTCYLRNQNSVPLANINKISNRLESLESMAEKAKSLPYVLSVNYITWREKT